MRSRSAPPVETTVLSLSKRKPTCTKELALIQGLCPLTRDRLHPWGPPSKWPTRAELRAGPEQAESGRGWNPRAESRVDDIQDPRQKAFWGDLA